MKKICVLGTTSIDQLMVSLGGIRRNTTNKVRLVEQYGGAMHNVAYHCGVLGAHPTFVTKLGIDSRAKNVRTHLENKGIRVVYEEVPLPTPVFTSVLGNQTEIKLSSLTDDFIYMNDDPIQLNAFADAEIGVTDNINDAFLYQLTQRMPNCRWIVSGRVPEDYLIPHLEGLVLNVYEFKEACLDMSTRQEINHLLSLGLKWIVLTLDRDGAVYYDAQQERHIKVVVKESPYPQGCGDAFLAGFVYALAHGKNMEEAIKKGHEIAGIILESPTTLNDSIASLKYPSEPEEEVKRRRR